MRGYLVPLVPDKTSYQVAPNTRKEEELPSSPWYLVLGVARYPWYLVREVTGYSWYSVIGVTGYPVSGKSDDWVPRVTQVRVACFAKFRRIK